MQFLMQVCACVVWKLCNLGLGHQDRENIKDFFFFEGVCKSECVGGIEQQYPDHLLTFIFTHTHYIVLIIMIIIIIQVDRYNAKTRNKSLE